jgi:SAM-dependent methyltransferase
MEVKLTPQTVRADFNEIRAILHYTKAAHHLGLWASERLLVERFFVDRGGRLLEAGCGAGRVAMGLWDLGYRNLAAFDFAEELLEQARSLAAERGAADLRIVHADATRLGRSPSPLEGPFDGVLFMFNGLMQIPGRRRRRRALRGLLGLCAPGAPLLFTTHDREASPLEKAQWQEEAQRWARGEQDPRLTEYGDRYFEDESGRTFMHLPSRQEILADLAATGWTHEFDSMRSLLAQESPEVREFSDECRFWVARRPPA